jgi:hypothetical protein
MMSVYLIPSHVIDLDSAAYLNQSMDLVKAHVALARHLHKQYGFDTLSVKLSPTGIPAAYGFRVGDTVSPLYSVNGSLTLLSDVEEDLDLVSLKTLYAGYCIPEFLKSIPPTEYYLTIVPVDGLGYCFKYIVCLPRDDRGALHQPVLAAKSICTEASYFADKALITGQRLDLNQLPALGQADEQMYNLMLDTYLFVRDKSIIDRTANVMYRWNLRGFLFDLVDSLRTRGIDVPKDILNFVTVSE